MKTSSEFRKTIIAFAILEAIVLTGFVLYTLFGKS
jgi:F0F1-type ATP synthase membrane subunit c/vacuolar-type H+-ATPase subunit K